MFQLPDSLSRNTGSAPRYTMGLALATNVSVEHSTSSPALTPARIMARWSAAVPELTAALCPVVSPMIATARVVRALRGLHEVVRIMRMKGKVDERGVLHWRREQELVALDPETGKAMVTALVGARYWDFAFAGGGRIVVLRHDMGAPELVVVE
jgi:hypothetical protein